MVKFIIAKFKVGDLVEIVPLIDSTKETSKSFGLYGIIAEIAQVGFSEKRNSMLYNLNAIGKEPCALFNTVWFLENELICKNK